MLVQPFDGKSMRKAHAVSQWSFNMLYSKWDCASDFTRPSYTPKTIP